MLTYRTAGPWGPGKGADLTPVEIDENFYDHEGRVASLELAGTAETNSIVDIVVNNGQVTIETADGTIFGPFALPVALPQYRGDWATGINYNFLDQFTVPLLGTFIVLQDHTSVTPFDPDRVIGGNPVYKLIAPPGAQGAAGTDGADGATGPIGPRGIFKIDASGLFAVRDAYDSELEGFTFLSIDGDGTGTRAMLYQKATDTDGDWDGPFEWEGDPGDDGAPGVGFHIDAADLFANMDSYLPAPVGYAYLSTDGDGAGGIDPVIFIRNISTWLGPFRFLIYGAGPYINAAGLYAGLSTYDAQPQGFTYLSTNGDGGALTGGVLFVKKSNTSADWSVGIAFQGPTGATGATGATGPQGDNFNVDAIGPFSGRAAHNGEAAGYSYLSIDGAGGVGPSVIYFKNSGTSGDWSAAVPFQGPVGPAGPRGFASTVPGPKGDPGTNFNPDAIGLFAGRAAYNAQPKDFSYLSTNGDGGANLAASLYIKLSNTSGNWSARIPFQGPKGATGSTGPTGAAGVPGPKGNTGPGLPVGGVAGQMPVKSSSVDFATAWAWPIETFVVALSDEATALTAATGVAFFRTPYKGQLVGLPRSSLNTASSSGLPTVDINKGGVTMLSTKLTIDATEKTSKTAATPAVVSVSTFNDDDELSFDIDTAGTGAKGLKVTLYLQRVP